MEFLCCYTQSKVPLEVPLSVVVVGDPGCGKTSLIYRFSRGRLPQADEMATAANLDTDCLDIVHSHRQVKLTLFDTSGHEDDAKIRALAYNQSDVIILCFSVDSPKALNTVSSEWAREVTYLNPGKPFILVGTKNDLRQAASTVPNLETCYVSHREGKKTKRNIGASAFFEFSATDPDSVQMAKRIFGRAIREGLKSSWRI
ncbi:GTP-binding protein rhoA [Elysia marginata]|uniref:GTP-binding protein rhoA n=1 Tax=Elysia marginata TaxID=1093978 RepID=A0AAV4I0V4_9GAST|nr:GTP-binding protein rhoA [Elysia marginata]